MKWYFRQLSSGFSTKLGSLELVNYVNTLLHLNGTSIDLINQNIAFKIYPNPAHNYVKFNVMLHNNRTISLKLYDLMGKLCLSTAIIDNGGKIDISKLKNGIYIYTIIIDERIEQGKIVKQ